VILALLTVSSVVLFGILQTLAYEVLAAGVSTSLVFSGFTAGVVFLLALQEAVHRVYSRRSGWEGPTRFLIPSVPLISPVLPSFGVLSSLRRACLNRDRLFDSFASGPLALLGASVVLYIVGSLTSFGSTVAVPPDQVLSPNLIQVLIGLALPQPPMQPPGFLQLSPLADAATIGFLLFFLQVLPLALYDGGHIALLLWGSWKWRLATYVVAFALVVVDTPIFWAPAVLSLLIAGRPPQAPVLDDVSPVSRNRRLLYVLILLLALASAPIPQNLATFSLG
jgi:hypothetical protein